MTSLWLDGGLTAWMNYIIYNIIYYKSFSDWINLLMSNRMTQHANCEDTTVCFFAFHMMCSL